MKQIVISPVGIWGGETQDRATNLNLLTHALCFNYSKILPCAPWSTFWRREGKEPVKCSSYYETEESESLGREGREM